jgi:glyoxylase-like metal-dependent hydrolase (beta-lactamase superfamily II)
MKPIALVAAVLALVAGTAACAGPAPYVLQSGHIDLDRGPDGNTVILDTPQGLVVVDTGRHPEHAEAILDHARKAGKPVIAIVNSHWHLDHSTGNRDVLAVFPKARVVTSRAVFGALDGFLAKSREPARKMLADPKLDPAERARIERAQAALGDRAALVPGGAVTRSGPLVLGGRRFEVRLAPNAATEGDVWLLAPDEGLAVVGDLVVAPVPFFDTACEEGWAKALDAIAKEKWTVLIPGHGAAMDRKQFNRWHSAYTRYVDCAQSSATAQACAAQWQQDAAGFYTPAERDDVGMMARYYVEQVLRAPADKRIAYCAKASSRQP